MIISRYIWGGKKPRVSYKTLQLPKEYGGMALPNLKNYYCAAQLSSSLLVVVPVLKWCENENAKWKAIEKEVMGIPMPSLLGRTSIPNKMKVEIDPISAPTLEIWYKLAKKHKLERQGKILSQFAYDEIFKPGIRDSQF